MHQSKERICKTDVYTTEEWGFPPQWLESSIKKKILATNIHQQACTYMYVVVTIVLLGTVYKIKWGKWVNTPPGPVTFNKHQFGWTKIKVSQGQTKRKTNSLVI